MSVNWHPSADDLGRCLRGELPDTQAGRVADHVDTCPDCQAALDAVSRPAPAPLGPPPDVPGFTLLDDGKPLGAGGMGEVFRAVEDGIGREVAVKIVHRCHAAHPHRSRLVFRFVEEVRLLGRIQHAGVPPVYRFGFLGDRADQPYLVMRLVPWPTLADELAADWAPGAPGPPPDRLNLYLIWFGRACEAVGYAHDHGAVHLDLKPANIKVHPSGEVQVLDWGLGRGFMATPDGRTQWFSPSAVEIDLGPVGHTAEYSPPEQVRGGHPDRKLHPRADVFALGSVLCEVLTGLPAFAGATSEERYDKAWRADLADARARLDRAGRDHPQLAALARRCLAAEPEHRPETAGAVAAEVRRIILSAEERLRSARWRFRVWAGVAAAAVLAAATAGVVAYRHSETERLVAQLKLDQIALDNINRAQKAEAEEKERTRVETQATAHLAAAAAAEAAAAAGDFEHPVQRAEQAAAWAAALKAAKAAEDAISGKAVSAGLTDRVRAAVRRVETGAATFDGDRAVVDALDLARARKTHFPDPDPDVRFSGAYFYSRGGVEKYATALHALGLTPNPTPDQRAAFVAAVGKRPRLVGPVVAALDQWFLLDRPADRLPLKLADRLDPDPVRVEVRARLGGGRAAVKKWLDDDPTRVGRLSPEAALLAAAGMEDWTGGGADPARDPDPAPGGRKPRGIDEAVALLRKVVGRRGDAAAERWDGYWLRLTLGFYLWNAAGDREKWKAADDAIPHLQAAEQVFGRGPVAAGDRSVVGVLRTAAGGQRAYVEARRARPEAVARVLAPALREYPGFWPLWHHAALVRLDHGDERGAAGEVRRWREHHPGSVAARGYAVLVESLAQRKPLEALGKLDELAETPGLSPLDQLHADDLRAVTDLVSTDYSRPARPGARHPTRPGHELLLVLDARARSDDDLLPDRAAAARPGAGLAPWLVGPGKPRADRLGRTTDEDWLSPRQAVAGYLRAAEAVPWATGPVHGLARAQLAAGQPADAAATADRLEATPGADQRLGLLQLYRARLHHAAADWQDDPGRAADRKEHRDRAADALHKAAETDAQFARHLRAADARADAVARVLHVLPPADPGARLAQCLRAGELVRELGPCWRTARLAAPPFRDPEFADRPFAAAPGGPRAAAVAGCAVLVAWGYRDVPPDPQLDARTRMLLLGRVRQWAEARPPGSADFLQSEVLVQFLTDLAHRPTLPAAGDTSDSDKAEWAAEREAWLLFRELNQRDIGRRPK